MSNETRKVPTRPGWWVGQRNAAAPRRTDNPEPHPIAVTMRGGKLCAGASPVTEPCWTWFGPVPGPAVLAALAEYSDAVHACDVAEAEIAPFLARAAAGRALRDVLRAERDGNG